MANTSVEWKIGDVLISTAWKGEQAGLNNVVTYLGDGDDEDTFTGRDADGDIFTDWVRKNFVLKNNQVEE